MVARAPVSAARATASIRPAAAAAAVAAVAAAAMLALATGCATAPTMDAASGGAAGADRSTSIAGTPRDLAPPAKFVVHAIESTARTLSVADLVRPANSVARSEIIEGDPVGGEVIERMTVERGVGSGVDRAAEHDELLIRSEERGGRTAERMTLRRDDDGCIRLERVDSILDRSRSEFAEPLLFAADLSGREALTATSPMKVLTLPALRERASGTARRSLRIAGECDLDLFGERLRAVAVDLEFDVELDVAVAKVRSRMFVVPGRGVVAEVRSESRKVLGLFRTTTSETTALRSVEEGAAPASAPTP